MTACQSKMAVLTLVAGAAAGVTYAVTTANDSAMTGFWAPVAGVAAALIVDVLISKYFTFVRAACCCGGLAYAAFWFSHSFLGYGFPLSVALAFLGAALAGMALYALVHSYEHRRYQRHITRDYYGGDDLDGTWGWPPEAQP